MYREISGWSYFKAKKAVNTINDIAINDIVPSIKEIISQTYAQALAKGDPKEIKKLKRLKYDRVNALSVAEVMQFWKTTHNNDAFSLYKEVRDTLIEVANEGRRCRY